MISISPPFALVSPWPAGPDGKPAPIPIELNLIVSLDPDTRKLLEMLVMAGKQEFLADLTARLDRIEGLLKAESDQAGAKDTEIADLKAKLADAQAKADAGISTEELQPLIDRLAKLESDAPNLVNDGTGTTGTPPDTGTDSGSPTEPPTPPTGDQPAPLTSVGVDSPAPPDNGPDNATA